MIIRKADVKHFMVHFIDHAEWDGEKYFITVDDPIAKGIITFMQYPNGDCTFYRKNDTFCDVKEIPLDNDVLWNYRKLLNKEIRHS